jgi:hypothetical protein
MKPPRNRLVPLGLLAVFMLACFTSPALAKKGDDEKLPPYDVTGMAHSKVWVPWVFAFLFAAGCVAIAFKNPHRSMTERD